MALAAVSSRKEDCPLPAPESGAARAGALGPAAPLSPQAVGGDHSDFNGRLLAGLRGVCVCPRLAGVAVKPKLQLPWAGAHVVFEIVVVRALVTAPFGIAVVHWTW